MNSVSWKQSAKTCSIINILGTQGVRSLEKEEWKAHEKKLNNCIKEQCGDTFQPGHAVICPTKKRVNGKFLNFIKRQSDKIELKESFQMEGNKDLMKTSGALPPKKARTTTVGLTQ